MTRLCYNVRDSRIKNALTNATAPVFIGRYALSVSAIFLFRVIIHFLSFPFPQNVVNRARMPINTGFRVYFTMYKNGSKTEAP